MSTLADQTFYEPLDETRSEIRLIEILSCHGDLLKCRLETVSLNDRPKFSALSYVWGDPKVTKDIELNGHTFPVTVNLANALSYVKEHWHHQFPDRDTSILRLWVDAICVNQRDILERNSQVRLMKDIYSNTELVLAWLGCGDEEMTIAIRILSTIALENENLVEEDGDAGVPDIQWLGKYPALCDEDGDDVYHSQWHPINKFLSHPYWERAWIFQEAVLGPSVVYVHGSASVTHKYLYWANSWLAMTQNLISQSILQKPPFVGAKVWNVLSMTNYYGTRIIQIEVWKLIIRNGWNDRIGNRWQLFIPRGFQATDSRDYIYGFLGLSDCGIIPDYQRDLNLVMHDLVERWLEETESLEWLRFAGVGLDDKTSDSRLPSWAPNYRLYPNGDPTHHLFFQAGHADKAASSLTGAVPRLLNAVLTTPALLGPAILQSDKLIPGTSFQDPGFFTVLCELMSEGSGIRGIQVLRAIYQAHSSFVLLEQTDEYRIRRAIGLLNAVVCYGLDKDKSHQIVSRMALLGLPPDANFEDNFFSIFLPDMLPDKELLNRMLGDSELLTQTMASSFLSYEAQMRLYRFVEIDHGFVGATPKLSRPGDVIAIFKGLNVPAVLRKCDDHYVFIGACHVPGLMNGEAKELLDSGKARVEEIEIR